MTLYLIFYHIIISGQFVQPSIFGQVSGLIGSLLTPGRLPPNPLHARRLVDQHIDPPGVHGNLGPARVHTRTVVPTGSIAHHTAGSLIPMSTVVNQHVDPPFTHGNHLPVPAVHTQQSVESHVGIGHRPAVVHQHVDAPFSHGNHLPVPAVHTQTTVGGHVGHGSKTVSVERHVDPPFTHGNHLPVPTVHSRQVVERRHGPGVGPFVGNTLAHSTILPVPAAHSTTTHTGTGLTVVDSFQPIVPAPVVPRFVRPRWI